MMSTYVNERTNGAASNSDRLVGFAVEFLHTCKLKKSIAGIFQEVNVNTMTFWDKATCLSRFHWWKWPSSEGSSIAGAFSACANDIFCVMQAHMATENRISIAVFIKIKASEPWWTESKVSKLPESLISKHNYECAKQTKAFLCSHKFELSLFNFPPKSCLFHQKCFQLFLSV